MAVRQHCPISFQLNGAMHQGSLRIEEKEEGNATQYRAVIETSPLHGTYGGYAATVELALDFLNLAMQAEGADQIHMECSQG